MSILKKLEELIVKKCINCKNLYFYHDGCYHEECVYITNCNVEDRCDFNCFEFVCENFEYEEVPGKNRGILRKWNKECKEAWERKH